MTTSPPELPRCVTDLSLGNPAPAPSGSLCGGGDGLTATELQAMAILRVARRAAAAEEGAAAAGLSMRRSMEWFLQRRREARRRKRGPDDADSAVASPSSSSFSCFTDTVTQ